ncbi:hypothetical protein [Ferruginibacter sp.]
MSENLHDIDKLFRDAIDEHQEMPSGKVWDAIDNNLDKSNIIQIKRKYNNLKRLAIALLLLLTGTIIYEIESKKTGGETIVQNDGKNNPANQAADNNTGSSKAGEQDKTVAGTNGDDKAAEETNSTASGSNETRNAVIDATKENSSTSSATIPTSAEKGITIQQQNGRNTIKIKQPVATNDDEAVNEDNSVSGTVTENKGRGNNKRNSTHKTKIRIKNGRAVEDTEGDEDNVAQNNTDKTANTGNIAELAALQNEKATALNIATRKNELKELTKRTSPEAVAKNSKPKKDRSFHFNIMPYYAPQFSFNRVVDDRTNANTGPPPRYNREQAKEGETKETIASFGILAEVPLTKRWSVQTGIGYVKKKVDIEPKRIYAKLDNEGKVKYRFDCSSGFIYISPKGGNTPSVGDSVSTVASVNSLQYISVPLAVNYTIPLGKLSIIPMIGATANFLTKQKIETEIVQGSTKEKQTSNNIYGLKSNYYSAFAGLGLEYNFNKRIALNITPTANFALNAINKDAAVKVYPNAVGIATGLKIKF